MVKKIRWGILGTANIACKKVIPAMREGKLCEISAISSRNFEKAKLTAESLGIEKFYGSYEDLIDDPEIDAIYNPLPNNMHLDWTEKSARAGKHVLCEKPIGLDALEVKQLIKIRSETNVKIQEAFMVRTHPQWIAVKELIRQGRIGDLHAIAGFFSYFNQDRANIRNKLEMGGGALMDIGCYCINLSRFIFEKEPVRVVGVIKRDSDTGIDKLTSAMLDFPNGHSSFTCSTQLVPYQRMQFLGTEGRIEVQIPFNIPADTPTKIFIDDGADLYGETMEIIEFDEANQYTVQGDLFSQAILEKSDQSIDLEDSLSNMAAIDAVFRSAQSGRWEIPKKL